MNQFLILVLSTDSKRTASINQLKGNRLADWVTGTYSYNQVSRQKKNTLDVLSLRFQVHYILTFTYKSFLSKYPIVTPLLCHLFIPVHIP